MFNIGGDFHKNLKYEPHDHGSDLVLSNDHKELLYFVTCFDLGYQKLSKSEVEQKGQLVADRILKFYLKNQESIDKFYSAHRSVQESNFYIADLIFRKMKEQDAGDQKQDLAASEASPESIS